MKLEKNNIITALGLVVFAIINILAINNYAYDKNGNIQCDNYVLNTYLYVILAFVIMFAIIFIDNRFNVFVNLIMNYGLFVLIGMFLLSIVFIILLNSTTNQLLSHTYWIVLLILLGLMSSLSVNLYTHMDINIIYYGLAITIFITGIMGFIGFKYGSLFITYNFDKYLKWALFGLVIASFLGIFLNIPNLRLYLSIASAIIFSLLLVSYNNKLRENAKTCTTPLYPKESFGLIIKIVNLLQDVMYLIARSRSNKFR